MMVTCKKELKLETKRISISYQIGKKYYIVNISNVNSVSIKDDHGYMFHFYKRENFLKNAGIYFFEDYFMSIQEERQYKIKQLIESDDSGL